jgi:hypothetical protein
MTRNRILLNFHSLLPHFTHHIPDLRLPCRQHEPSTLAAVHGGGGARFVKTLGNRETAPLAVAQLAIAVRAPEKEVASRSCGGRGAGRSG